MIFITGGTGLVGSHLLYELTRQGKPVCAVRRASSNLEQVKHVFGYYTDQTSLLFDRINWVEADVLDPGSIKEAMKGAVEVYHCAAMVSFRSSDKQQMLRNNIEGTANVVNSALDSGVRKFCFVSSTAALGAYPSREPVTETGTWRSSKSHSAYAVSKYRSEMEVWRGISEGLPAVIVNPSVILGPGTWNRGSSSFFGVINRGMTFYTNGVTGYVDVRDVVTIMVRLMESEIMGERFILASENLSYRDIFSMISEELGKKPPCIWASPFLSELAWAGSGIRAFLTGSDPLITREMIRAAHSEIRFSSEKIRKALGIDFIPMKQSIHDIANLFIKDVKDRG